MTRDRLLQKIRKCLALSASSNANEAATALRQAQRLMAKHGITDADVRLADVSTAHCTTALASAPGWMVNLSAVVARAFRCECWYTDDHSYSAEHVVFCGVSAAPQLAVYSFTVLRRLLANQRADFYRRSRGKRINRIARADDFALGWISSIAREVARFAGDAPAQVLEYKAAKGLIAVRTRNHGKGDRDPRALNAGWHAATGVRLQHGVGGTAQQRIGGGES